MAKIEVKSLKQKRNKRIWLMVFLVFMTMCASFGWYTAHSYKKESSIENHIVVDEYKYRYNISTIRYYIAVDYIDKEFEVSELEFSFYNIGDEIKVKKTVSSTWFTESVKYEICNE